MKDDFEIMPFRYLPCGIRWAYAVLANKEYGDTIYETVDDVDWDDVGVFWYGAVFSDGSWIVDESHEEVLYDVINSRDD